MLGVFIIVVLLFSEIGVQVIRADDDPDLYGIYRNYNTDDSREASIAFDYSDDEVWKAFYIGYQEKQQAHYAFLWVYGRSFGVPYETTKGYSHKIILYNDWYLSGIVLYTFYSFEKFDSDVFHWQRFYLSTLYFQPTSWNRIEIMDCDSNNEEYSGWEINNLRIGIDQSFESIDDFDQSYWYSGGAGVTPDNPRDIEGELMIALEFVDVYHDTSYFPALQSSWDHQFHLHNYAWVYLDDGNDRARWKVNLTNGDFDHSSYARLYFYGWAWTNNPGLETTLNIKVNGLVDYDFHPMQDFGECKPIGGWSWIEIDLDDLDTGVNEFEFYDTSTTGYTHTNFALLRFTTCNSDHSCWQYTDDLGEHGTLQYSTDYGELGVYLVLFDNTRSFNMDRTIYTIEMSRNPQMGTEPYKQFQPPNYVFEEGPQYLGSYLDMNQGWQRYECIQQDWTDPDAYQGYIYDENSYTRGDCADLVLISGHGSYDEFALQLYQYGQDSTAFADTYSFKDINFQGWEEDYTEAEYLPYPISTYATRGEDGFNFNTEWLIFLSCNIMGKVVGGQNEFNEESSYRTLLYHGLHAVMGYYDSFSMQPGGGIYQFTVRLYNYLTEDSPLPIKPVIDAFIETSTDFDHQPWAWFAHESNRDDYLWGEGDVSSDNDCIRDQKFENKDDIQYDYYGS